MRLKRNQLLIIFLAAGFLIGTYYAARNDIKTEIFDKTAMEDLSKCNINGKEYFLYILRERVGLFCCILFLSNLRYKRVYALILTFVFGVAGGGIITMSVMQAGVKGVLLSVTGILSYWFLYGLAYGILSVYWMKDGKGRWNREKTAAVVIAMLLGIVCESYIHPVLFKMFW